MYAAGSEDMDTLTFSSPILLRHLTFSEAKKMPITEIRLDRALEGLEMSMDQVSAPSSCFVSSFLEVERRESGWLAAATVLLCATLPCLAAFSLELRACIPGLLPSAV